MSDILEPLAKANEDPREAQSMEELMRSIKEANMRLSEVGRRDCLIGSMDVEAWYPSLDQRQSVKMVREEYIRSEFEVKDVN